MNKNTISIEKYLNNIDASLVILDANGEIEWASKGFYSLYGYNESEYNKKNKNAILSLGNEDLKTIINELKETKETIEFINYCSINGGYDIWVQTNITPIFNEKDVLEKIILVENDITAFKEAEESFHQQNEHMQSLNEYLEEAYKQLEQQTIAINTQREEIEVEKQKADNLLLNMFPRTIAHQLKKKGSVKPKHFKQVTVLFTDFKNFTKTCENLEPTDIVSNLHFYFERFDGIISGHFIEKIKTIGDAYLCVGGLPMKNKSHSFNVVLAALEIQYFMNKLNDKKVINGEAIWELRCGIHTGEVVAGVVGKHKYVYDIWGDTVNIASRMESSGHVGMVNVSESTYNEIKDYFTCTYRGKMDVKNKGKIDMYFVNGLLPEYSENADGITPNDVFKKFISTL